MRAWEGTNPAHDSTKGHSESIETINQYLYQLSAAMRRISDGKFPVVGDPGSIGIKSHHLLDDLTNYDDHPQYLYLAGRLGGQSAYGGTASIDSLTLLSNTADGNNAIQMVLDGTGKLSMMQKGYSAIPFDLTMSGLNSATLLMTHTPIQIVNTSTSNPDDRGSVHFLIKSPATQTADTDIMQIWKGTSNKIVRLHANGCLDLGVSTLSDASVGTNVLYAGGDSRFHGSILLDGATSGTLTVLASPSTASHSLTMPSAQGAASTFLKNDGAGALSWVAGTGVVGIFDQRASQSLTSAASTIVLTDGSPVAPLTSTGNYTLTSVPTIANGRDGQLAILLNTGSNTITLQDMGTLGGSNLRLAATTRALSPLRGVIELVYNTAMNGWVEKSFQNILTFTPSIATFTIDGSSAVTRQVALTSTSDAVPTFAMTYVGVPSAASIDIDAGGGEIVGSDYPISVPSAYLSLTSGTSPPSKAFYKGNSVAQVRTFTLTATVSGTAGLTLTCAVTYYNSRFGGINTQSTALSSAQTLALGLLATDNSKTGSFAANATASNYFWYSYRSALGQIANDGNGFPCFSVNSERAGFVRVGTGTVSVTNSTNFVETFEQYRSISTGLGNKTVAALSSAANNRIFMGPNTGAGPLSSANIIALDDTANGTSNLNPSVAGTYAVTITGSNYLWFCYPATMTLSTIKDVSTGFGVAGSLQADVSVTNDMGYTESFHCWRSDNVGIFPSGGSVVVT